MSDFTLTTKIYFSALYFWTYVFYYCSSLFTNILWFIVTYTPDSLIIYKIPFLKCKTNEIDIIYAQLIKQNDDNTSSDKVNQPIENISNKPSKQKNTNVTNVIKLLINIYWDNDIKPNKFNKSDSDNIDEIDDGGIDLDKLFDIIPEFRDSVIFIKYARDLHKIFKEVVPTDVQKVIDIGIQKVIIDSRNKGSSPNNNGKQYDIYKNNDLKKNYKNIFNELSF
jgi:hypothetical protein